jgi:hypothetical protein
MVITSTFPSADGIKCYILMFRGKKRLSHYGNVRSFEDNLQRYCGCSGHLCTGRSQSIERLTNCFFELNGSCHGETCLIGYGLLVYGTVLSRCLAHHFNSNCSCRNVHLPVFIMAEHSAQIFKSIRSQ